MRLATKLRWLSLTIVVCTALGVAAIGYWGNSAIISGLQTEVLEKRANLEADHLGLAFSELDRDIRFIYNLPLVQKLADTSYPDEAALTMAKDDLATIFEQMLKAKPHYAQIRLIGVADNGRELVRVDQNGEIVRVPESQLQEKGNRPYFNETMERGQGVIYHSAIDLNKEHGMVELPIKPVLRVGMPVYSSGGEAFGMVVINLHFRSFMDAVLLGNQEEGRFQYYLLNQYGEFLYHPDPSHTFGFDLGFDLKAEDEFTELSDFYKGSKEQVTFKANGIDRGGQRLVHFRKFKVFEPEQSLVFGIVASYEDIGRASLSITLMILAAICILVLIALFLTVRFSKKITQPLERITLATRRFANHSDEVSSLPTQRYDEIGDLAKTFEEMKTSIERHQTSLMSANQRLAEMNRDLEHFARVASHDLREPIQRIAGLASLYHSEHGSVTEAESEEILQQLNDECEKALRQLADFREFTRISEDASLVREEASLTDIVESVLREFDEALKQRKVEVSVGELPTQDVFKNLLRVLYRNLVDNALQFGKEDGFSLEFTCEVDADGDAVLGVKNSSSHIGPENLNAVFDIFRKLENVSGGNGVGLAICKRIVDFHGGRIWVESSDNFVHIKFKLFESE